MKLLSYGTVLGATGNTRCVKRAFKNALKIAIAFQKKKASTPVLDPLDTAHNYVNLPNATASLLTLKCLRGKLFYAKPRCV